MMPAKRDLHWRRPGAILCLLGFLLSHLAHLLTFVQVDLSSTLPIWLLHLGAIVGCGAMIIQLRRLQPPGRRPHLPAPPSWVAAVVVLVLLYVLLNFVLFCILSAGGTPQQGPDGYFLSDHGRVIRPLTEIEYRQQSAYRLRGFSGHWMLFYLIPGLYFLLAADTGRRATEPK